MHPALLYFVFFPIPSHLQAATVCTMSAAAKERAQLLQAPLHHFSYLSYTYTSTPLIILRNLCSCTYVQLALITPESSVPTTTPPQSMSNRNQIADFALKLTGPISAAGFSGRWETGESSHTNLTNLAVRQEAARNVTFEHMPV